MKLSVLLSDIRYRSAHSAEEIEISGVSDHTADILTGHLFIYIPGAHFDPRPLFPLILKTGISAILSQEPLPEVEERVPVFYAENIRAAAAFVFYRYYGKPCEEMRLVAVTGTNGKTTTARMLCHLLDSSGIHSGYIGTLGTYDQDRPIDSDPQSTMTTPSPSRLYRSLARLAEAGVRVAVLEVSSHAIAQDRTAPLRFSLGLFTNLSAEHLDYHPSLEEYYKTKASLFDRCDCAVINVDDAYGERLSYELHGERLTCGILHSAAFSVIEPNEIRKKGTNYTYLTPFGSFSVFCPLPGVFNVYNSLLAATAALRLGLCGAEIKRGMRSLPPVCGRMERLSLDRWQTGDVIIDYAHTPVAVKEALKAARAQTDARLIVLFGAGGERDRGKRAEMGRLAVELADFAYITADNTRSEALSAIIKDILKGVGEHKNYRVISNRRRAICEALDELKAGDTLLLLGKGHECYDLTAVGRLPFSEREIVFSHLEETKG